MDTTACTIAQEGFARFVSLSLELTRVRAGTRPGGPPQRSVVRGRGGRRPSHGVAGTTPVSHGGRLFVACPRTQGAGRGSHSAILGQPHCRGPAEYWHVGGNSYERHRRHVPLGVPRDDLLPTERWPCVPIRWSGASEAGSSTPRTPGEGHGSHSATLVLPPERGKRATL